MTITTFDTRTAVEELRAAGVGDRQAETLVDVISRALGERVTRADIEPLATKEFVRAEIAGLDAKITGIRTDVDVKIAGVDVKIAGVRTEIAGVRTEIANLEARLFRHLWVMAAGIVGATFTLLKLFP